MGFSIYGPDGYLGHVTRTICKTFGLPIIRSVHVKFEFNYISMRLLYE